MINDKILEEIREQMIREIRSGKNIVNVEKHLFDYIRKLDSVELTKKYHCTLVEAIDTLDILQDSNEIKKILTILD